MNRFKKIWPILLVILIVLVAYGQTLLMYFWQDDSALIFKLQNPGPAAGSFGEGLWERGPYQYLVVPFVPFFPLFGLEPFGYFLIGLIGYLISAWAFYFFARELFDKKKWAYLATLIYAAGFVGSDIMFRIINSWQSTIGLTLALFSFGFYVRFLKKGRGLGYLSSLLLYLASVEFVFIRSHSLIIVFVLLDVLFRSVPISVKKLGLTVIRLIPFLFIFWNYYLNNNSFSGPGATTFVNDIFVNRDFSRLAVIFANICNIFVWQNIQTKMLTAISALTLSESIVRIMFFASLGISVGIFALPIKSKKMSAFYVVTVFAGLFLVSKSLFANSPAWQDTQVVLASLIGLGLLLFCVVATLSLWRKDRLAATILALGFAIASSQYLGYHLQYPTAVFTTTHRYFNYSLIGYALFWIALAKLVVHKHKFFGNFLVGSLVIGSLYLGFQYQSHILNSRSSPSRKFYADLLTFAPKVDKGSVFYFDVAADPTSQQQFGDSFSVGSMPETTALAIYYGLDRYDIKMYTDFQELAYALSRGEFAQNTIHAFHYSQGGLIDKTKDFDKLLTQGQKTSLTSSEGNYATILTTSEKGSVGDNLPITIPLDVDGLTPVKVSIDLNLSGASVPESFPYQQKGIDIKADINHKRSLLRYLGDRDEYYRSATAQSLSEWKYREIRNIIDNDLQTLWQGHRIWWHEKSNEAVTIDLSVTKRISTLLWINGRSVLTPTDYQIAVSQDGMDWVEVLSVTNGESKADGAVTLDKFDPINARFIRMTITQTASEDSPSITEIEVIDEPYTWIDPEEAAKFFTNPFSHVSDPTDWNGLFSEFSPIAKVGVSWVKDGNSRSIPTLIPIKINERQVIEFVVPAGGDKITKVELYFTFPFEARVNSVTTQNLTLNDLEAMNLVKEFNEN